MGTLLVSTVLAAMAGIATYSTWRDNRGVSIVCAIVFLISGIVAVVAAIGATVSLVVKLLPLILIVIAAFVLWKMFSSGDGDEARPSPGA
ncbi:hypothetical protein [Corynebacterium otitidis]|uniref:Putative membrane protein n=1 Tax=Corynebacterium otitidis ATCC 51513 TaxID=883169 RepID=I7L7S8_9CORY|nr:hypothetical protein [Corynebacterium otitidis]EJZ82528.1 hypothetical protein HMPREF9719_00516 [Corynebacterium otitidis ATCC 51513]KKO83236.1 membrane protein [Corynebacterium otitidis]CCI82817.1 putative membrane protein [Corynebacterium otitidis ATCC 51513]